MRFARWLALAGAGAGLVACAPLQPMVASSTFEDHRPTPPPAPVAKAKAPVAVAAPSCQIKVAAITDARRAPDVLGVVAGRAVKSPDDPVAWLKSILGGLEARGVAVAFAPDAAASSNTVVARVALQSAWLTAVATNKTANVVLHVRAERTGRPLLDRDYRGALTVMNWNSSPTELQHLADQAFTNALDEMAPDLLRLCAG